MAAITIATEPFAGSDVNPLPSPWITNGAIGHQQVGNRARVASLSANASVSQYGNFNVRMMRTTATVANDASTGQLSVGVRCSSTAYTFYLNLWVAGGGQLYTVVAGGYTTKGSGYTGGTTGDTIGLLATGSDLYGYKNGSISNGPVSDSTIESGTWCFRIQENTSIGNSELDDIVMETYEPVFMGAGAKGAAASGNVTLIEPTYATSFTKANGDIWIAAVHSSDQVAHTFTDWTQIAQANGGSTNSRLSVWYFRYAGSNPNFVVTHASGQSPVGGIAAFRGCLATGSPVDVSSAIAAGTDATIEHTAVTPTIDETKLLVINGAGDDNTRTALTGYTVILQESTNNCFLNALGNPDGSVCIFLKNTNVGQTVSSGTVTVTQAAVDSWASMLLALAPAEAAATPITVDLSPDALGSYADALTVDKQDVAGTTPKEANFAPDALGSYADAPALRLAFMAAPAADSMPVADQSPTVNRLLAPAPAADSLGLYADAPTILRAFNVAFTDALGPYVDQAPTISEGILIAPAADSLPAYADTTNGFFTLAPRPSDDLNQWTDQRTVFLTGEAALTPEPPPDNLGGYADQPTIREAFLVTPAADSLPAYADSSTGFFTFTVRPTDDLNQWADQRTVFITGMAALTPEPPADSLNNWTDVLTSRFGEFVLPIADSMTMADQLGVTLLTVKSAGFTDALPSYTDQVSIVVQKSAGFSEALGSYSDSYAAAAAKNISRTDALANWADQLSGGKQSTTRIGWQDSVVATTLPVRIGWIDSVTVFRSLGTDKIVQLTSIKPVYIDTPNLLYGLNHGFVIYLVDENGNYILDENGNRIITSGLIDNLAQGDSVAITRTQQNITPIDKSFTDALPVYTDALQVTRGIIPREAIFSDPLETYNDAPPQIERVGFLRPSFSDNLAGYGDSPAVSTTGEKRISQSDAMSALIDSVQIYSTGFLTAAASDSLENYVDDATINTSGGIAVPLSDALDPHVDSIQAHRTGALTVLLTDAIGVPVDAVGITRAGILRVTASDNLAAYTDSPTHGRGLFYSIPPDNLANYLDVTTIGGSGQLQAALSDNLGQYSDSRTTFSDVRLQLPADDLNGYGDAPTNLLALNYSRIDPLFGPYSQDGIDARIGSIDELRYGISDDLNQWADATISSRIFFAIRIAGKTTDTISLTGKVLEEQIGLNGKVHDKTDISGEIYIGDP